MRLAPALAVPMLALPLPAIAQRPLPFGDGGWELRGDSTAVETVDGRAVVRLQTGGLVRRDVRLEDGTIDVDVMFTRRRSFVYVAFRMADDDNHEEFYLRPHKSLLPDAVQYAPVDRGQSAWQLHHGPGGTAAPELAPNVWTRLRVVVQGRRAALFLGDTVTPVLVVPRLAREPRPGYIALSAFVPPGTPGAGAVARFANARVSPGVVAYAFGPAAPDTAPPAGTIREWSVSPPFAPADSVATTLAPAWLAAASRAAASRVRADPRGLVNLARDLGLPAPSGRPGASTVARVRLVAERAGLRRLDLGFSDAATVFLNGVPLFHGDDSYAFAQRRDGLIGVDQAAVWLPLRAGPNDLAVVVTDRFGGWGLMGRLADPSGVRIEAP